MAQGKKILLLANTDWYLYNYRLGLAQALQAEGWEVRLASPAGAYGEALRAEGLTWQAVRLSRRGMNPLAELGALLRLARLYRREAPDVAQHFTIKCVIYGSLAARLAGVRQVVNSVTGRGFVFSHRGAAARMMRPLVKALYRLALRGTRVIFQNTADLQAFCTEGLIEKEQGVVIAGSGVDTARLKAMAQPKGSPLAVLPARMLWEKGVGEFVQAARLLKAEGLAARLALVGETDSGNPDAVPAEQLRAWQAEGAVEWWGWQEDMREVYRQAAVVCLPSYYGEGLARALVEGAACGRALVATDVPGCRETVREGVNGLLVPARDSAALAEALGRLLRDAQTRERMGKESRKLAEAAFSAEVVNRATISVYNQMGARAG